MNQPDFMIIECPVCNRDVRCYEPTFDHGKLTLSGRCGGCTTTVFASGNFECESWTDAEVVKILAEKDERTRSHESQRP